MRPFHHAKISAGRDGRDWHDDLHIHEFIDSSKVGLADLRHRMILHSVDFGAELAARAFPDRADVRELVRAHVIEDMQRAMTLADWLSYCTLPRLPQPRSRLKPSDWEVIIASETARFSLADDSGPRKTFALLALATRFVPPEQERAAWAILGNAFGVGVVRRILGPPAAQPGLRDRTVIFDPAWCAERMIYWLFHSIPDLRRVVETCDIRLDGMGDER